MCRIALIVICLLTVDFPRGHGALLTRSFWKKERCKRPPLC